MKQASPEMVRRVAAAQATLARFRDRPFRWGSNDCARMAAFHLRQMGHKPQLAKAGSYRSALAARAALKRLGFATLAEALDAIGLQRVAPAEAWVGDIVMGDSGDVFGALGVLLGNEAMIGFHEHAAGATVLRHVHLVSAWRL
ncbi:hypothetical protein SAMN05192583_0895 [Sphingomonas gellani]|uniref:DUF6950 domain-containing protein n=1 Tax=Sphingomonas gellani TaxID=1166340 RepID=A0A1H7ZX47_9SPHN|nr:hypothetical protein [Sphingomonas gellani]SEM63035.1 hypothetical protein SAMN05192583_0895 [Sphingomonas gellani]